MPNMPKPKEDVKLKINTNAVVAGMVATGVTHPLDVLKIRQQISAARCTTLHLATRIMRQEGWQAFYCGLTAGLLRQATYTAARLSMFDMLYCKFLREKCYRPEGWDKVKLGIAAGMFGAVVGNPSEVVLVRRIVQGCQRSPVCGVCCRCRPCYTGTLNAIKRIICADGFSGLWRGTTLTLLRSVVLSTLYIGNYGEVRCYVKKYTCEEDPFTLRVYTAIAMGFIAAVLTSPIDVVKTFYQSSCSDNLTQRETLQCIIRQRGYRALYKGFTPYFARMAIHTVVAFMALDNLKNVKVIFKK